MWILLVVFAHLSPDAGLTSKVTTQEFQNEQRCRAAETFVVSAPKPGADSVESASQNGIQSGTIREPRTIVLQAECPRK